MGVLHPRQIASFASSGYVARVVGMQMASAKLALEHQYTADHKAVQARLYGFFLVPNSRNQKYFHLVRTYCNNSHLHASKGQNRCPAVYQARVQPLINSLTEMKKVKAMKGAKALNSKQQKAVKGGYIYCNPIIEIECPELHWCQNNRCVPL